jgi:hypothetical protein
MFDVRIKRPVFILFYNTELKPTYKSMLREHGCLTLAPPGTHSISPAGAGESKCVDAINKRQ